MHTVSYLLCLFNTIEIKLGKLGNSLSKDVPCEVCNRKCDVILRGNCVTFFTFVT